MKIKNILFLFLALLAISCEKEEVAKPNAIFSVSSNEVSVNETVIFKYMGVGAKQVAVFTGDAGHDFELKNQSNSGFVMSKGLFTYAYKKAGTYKIVIVATNYDKEGEIILSDTTESQIIVKDDRADIKSISLKKDIYNKEIIGNIIDSYILFAVPYKVRVNNRDIAVNLSQQRIEISTYSDAAKIYLNEQEFQATTKYDFTKPLILKIQAPAGNEKVYSIQTLRYPVFETFTINNVTGTVQYSDFDFNRVYIKVSLPKGTNVTSLVPVFTSSDAQTIKVNDIEQISGQSILDFSNPVTYILKSWKDDNENLSCETYIEVSVVLQ
jgi:hypothetical protein